MRSIAIICLLFAIGCCAAETLQFNLVIPTNDSVANLVVNIVSRPGEQKQSFQLTTNLATINATHQFVFSSDSPVTSELAYQYQINYKDGTSLTENFWRKLDECRLIVSGEIKRTKNEFFNQVENELGLPKIPNFSGAPLVIPPEYFDDNQVITVSLQISQTDLDTVIFLPQDEGETYVKTNITMVSLKENEVFINAKIRRAGGMSLHTSPYSYQVKLSTPGAAGESTVIKFKAYPYDYQGGKAGIIAEKAASDVCYSVGAPINFVSYVRLFINSVDQGLYGMLEKVDENFIEKRWPYLSSGQDVGDLYKLETWNLLNTVGFEPNVVNFINEQTSQNTTCCTCFANGCDVSSPDCRIFDDDDTTCPPLDCCSCDWQSNGDVDAQTVNCDVLNPMGEFLDLGNAIIDIDSFSISSIIDQDIYMRSLLCSLAVLNPDGYIYNAKNYYWYRHSVTGQFKLILYDQDTCFGTNRYSSSWDPWNWPMQGDLTDALILPTLFQLNSTLVDSYNNLATSFLTQYYRSDLQGPMFERMNILSNFVSKYNPGRSGVDSKTQSYQKYFISPLSATLQTQFGVPPTNPPTSVFSPVCDATSSTPDKK